MSDMRRIIKSVTEAVDDDTRKARRLSIALSSDILNSGLPDELQQKLHRAVHAILDEYAPGWDYDG